MGLLGLWSQWDPGPAPLCKITLNICYQKVITIPKRLTPPNQFTNQQKRRDLKDKGPRVMFLTWVRLQNTGISRRTDSGQRPNHCPHKYKSSNVCVCEAIDLGVMGVMGVMGFPPPLVSTMSSYPAIGNPSPLLIMEYWSDLWACVCVGYPLEIRSPAAVCVLSVSVI